MYEFWCDYIKPKYKDKARLCHMDTDSFIINIKTEDFYEDIADDVEKWFDTSNYDQNDKRPLPIGINKRIIGKFKEEVGGLIMEEFVRLRAKPYLYLIDGYNDEDYEKNKIIINEKAKGTKKCVIKRELMFDNYKESLSDNKIISKSQQRFKSDHREVCTEEINKITLSSNDDKRLQTYDRITPYPYGMNAFKVCESEMLLSEKITNNIYIRKKCSDQNIHQKNNKINGNV